MVTVILLALPLAGLALLLIRPEWDMMWQHNPSHFWLVVGVAFVAVLVGLVMGEAARKRRDPRVFLVSLAFLSASGFLALHALATPGVLLEGSNAGFDIATPVGLFVASLFAAGSAMDRVTTAISARAQQLLRLGVIGLLLAWAVVSLAGLPPLHDPQLVEAGEGWLVAIGVAGTVIYALASVLYLRVYRDRRAGLVLAVVATWVLLGESMLAVTVSRNWHLSWWEWHILMAVAFVVTAVAVRSEYRRLDSVPATFSGLYLDSTLGRVDRERADAVKALVAHDAPPGDVAARFGLSSDEAAVLIHAAQEIRELDELFAPYLSTQLASRLRSDPGAARLGGETREVSVLFADLAGFTAFSERALSGEVVEMLNEYWSRTLPAVESNGGYVDSIAGDAVIVVFNVTGSEPDHPYRASVAARSFQAASGEVAAGHPDWPRFRIGVNTGTATVASVGSSGRRSFTVIGDAVNVASRLQAEAAPGEILIGEATRAGLGPRGFTEPAGELTLRGKEAPVPAFRLIDVS